MLIILKAAPGTYYKHKINNICSIWVNTFAPKNWDLFEGEMPVPIIEYDANENDYIEALNTLGVDTNEEN